jgi:CheY-like chemotaxis protein
MSPKRIMIIDDDATSNMICKMIIKKVLPEIELTDILHPQRGMDYIKDNFKENSLPICLLLDINMPDWSGWDFLDHFIELPDYIKNKFTIYMLSSSVNKEDLQKAATNTYVKDYIEKPLSKIAIERIMRDA